MYICYQAEQGKLGLASYKIMYSYKEKSIICIYWNAKDRINFPYSGSYKTTTTFAMKQMQILFRFGPVTKIFHPIDQ
jgi:hypothetical protein